MLTSLFTMLLACKERINGVSTTTVCIEGGRYLRFTTYWSEGFSASYLLGMDDVRSGRMEEGEHIEMFIRAMNDQYQKRHHPHF